MRCQSSSYKHEPNKKNTAKSGAISLAGPHRVSGQTPGQPPRINAMEIGLIL